MDVSVDTHCKINLKLFIFTRPIFVSSLPLSTCFACLEWIAIDCNGS